MSSLKPTHTTDSLKSQERDKFKHSFTGLKSKHGAKPAKGGKGGKFSWEGSSNPLEDEEGEYDEDYDEEVVEQPKKEEKPSN